MTPAGVVGADAAAAASASPAPAAAPNPWANAGRLQAALAAEARAQAASAPVPASATQPAAAAPLKPAVAAAVAQPATAPAWGAAQLAAAAAPFDRRGFVNSGNLCFANATLQALLGLEPFVALLRHLSDTQLPQQPSTATLRSLAALAREFPEAEAAPARAPQRSSKNAVCVEDSLSPFLAMFDASVGAVAAPTARGARQAARRVRQQQQDAHEFMSSLLDHAHMELVQLSCAQAGQADDAQPAAEAEETEWECVGRRRNTSFVARKHEDASTPVTDIFGGVQASVVKRSGAKPSVTQEPFKILSLDVSADHVLTLEDALGAYCAAEALEGFHARGEETAASRSLHIAEAPRVLLLHLKLFRFTERGEEKVSKRVQFSETLALSRAVCGGREGARYRLAAVVEHIGSTPRSGHYVAYAQGGGAASWLRFDDTTVQPCSLQSVLARPAYILAYERVV